METDGISALHLKRYALSTGLYATKPNRDAIVLAEQRQREHVF